MVFFKVCPGFPCFYSLTQYYIQPASACEYSVLLPSRFSCVRLFVTLWTIAGQAPLSMEFSRQEYWSGLPFPSPGDLSDPGIEPVSFTSPALAGSFFTTSTTWAGSSVHGILQARILEWVVISFARGPSQPRDQTHVSCIGRQVLHHWATRETPSPPLGSIFQVAVVRSGQGDSICSFPAVVALASWQSLRACPALGLEITVQCARRSNQQLVLLPLLCIQVTSIFCWSMIVFRCTELHVFRCTKF